MGIKDSYHEMFDQLTTPRFSAFSSPDFGELMRNSLLQQEMARRPLLETLASYQHDLFQTHQPASGMLASLRAAEWREARSPLASATAALEMSTREMFSMNSTALTRAWEQGLVVRDPLPSAAASLLPRLEEPNALSLGVLEVARQWERKLMDSRAILLLAATEWDSKHRESFAYIEGIEKIALAVPKLALETWPDTLVSQRINLIEHSLRNVSALSQLQASSATSAIIDFRMERLAAAGELVLRHSDLLRRMPPELSIDVRPNPTDARDEEIGAKLEPLLHELDPRLLDLRRQSWRKLSDGVAGARMAMLGLREILSEVLRMLAPDDEVVRSDVWKNRLSSQPARPTRKERISYLIGPNASVLEVVLQFGESVECANKFSHTFANDQESVRVWMAQLENWIYMILLYARKSN